jgi:hypothetical protein
MALTELVELMAAELKAVNDLNEKLAAKIEALEARANYQAGTIAAHNDRLRELEVDAEINAVEWVPDIQWHKDNGYPI